MNSQSLFERSLSVAPGGVHSPVRSFKSVGLTPIFFKSAEGAYLTSVEGKRYVDFCQSFGPLILGHRDSEVSKVVHEMVDTAWTFGACEPYSLELAEWMTARLPWAEKVRFVCSGTEAVMSALRVARAATGRNKILKFEGCYHGHADSLLVKAGSGLAGESAADSAGVSANVASETLTCLLNDDASVERTFEKHGSEIAALILEPLPANYGLLIQRKEFIQKCVDLARKHGALVIFDEVISGFRVDLGGMAKLLGITPDLVTYGKIIGGGFPVGAYAGKKKYLDLVAPQGGVYQAGTLSANPIGMRAGLTSLMKAERLHIYPELEKRTRIFAESVNKLFDSNNAPFQMVHFGSLFWVHGKTNKTIRSLTDIPQGHKEGFNKLFKLALDEGVYFAPSAYEVGFLSLAHNDNVLDEALDKLGKAWNGKIAHP